jgi:hypothetical protein
MLERKVDQKRDQLTQLIKKNFEKLLPNQEITVSFPDLTGLTIKDKIQNIREFVEVGILPRRYAQRKALEFLGLSEDIEEVELLEQSELQEVNQMAQSRALEIKARIEAEKEIQEKEKQQAEIQNLTNQLND